MTMIENWMISFERGGEVFERFLDDDSLEFDDFFRTEKGLSFEKFLDDDGR